MSTPINSNWLPGSTPDLYLTEVHDRATNYGPFVTVNVPGMAQPQTMQDVNHDWQSIKRYVVTMTQALPGRAVVMHFFKAR